jgi:hypothetical protein
MRFGKSLYLLAIGIWLGSILFFGAVLAPGAFSVLPRHLAADIVGRNLNALHWLGFVCGAIAIICALLAKQRMWLRMAQIAAMLAFTAISQFAITPRIHAIREQPGFEQQASEAQRRSFARLHAASTTAEGIVFLLGLAAFFLTEGRD